MTTKINTDWLKNPEMVKIARDMLNEWNARELKRKEYFNSDDFTEKFLKCKKYLKRSKYSLGDDSYHPFPVRGVSNDDFTLIVETIIMNSEKLTDKECGFSNNLAIHDGVTVRMMYGQGTAFNMWVENEK